MPLGVLVERREHDWEYDFDIVADQIAEVLVVPKVECPFGNLEVRACNRLGQLVEEGLLDFGELGWIHDLEDIFNFVEEHDLLCAVDFGPIAQ